MIDILILKIQLKKIIIFYNKNHLESLYPINIGLIYLIIFNKIFHF